MAPAPPPMAQTDTLLASEAPRAAASPPYQVLHTSDTPPRPCLPASSSEKKPVAHEFTLPVPTAALRTSRAQFFQHLSCNEIKPLRHNPETVRTSQGFWHAS